MRKGKYEEIIICPFNVCHRDVDYVGMGSLCMSCEYSELKGGKVDEVIILSGTNSKEVKKYKDYEMLHIPICVDKEIVESLKKKKCIQCGNDVVGKGFIVHDTFGEIDYIFCDRACYNKFENSGECDL